MTRLQEASVRVCSREDWTRKKPTQLHREVNQQRKTVFRFIELMLSIYSVLCVLSMVVLFYDWVFIPRPHWSLIFLYCSLGSFFSFVAMRNWVKMNASNDELLRQVAEATGGLGEREI